MKKLSAIIMLYSNLQYSEIPDSKIPELIKKSYEPVFDLIAKRPKTKILLGITGRSLEILKKINPQVLDKLKNLVKNRKIYIVGGTYTNPILPLIPEENRLKQIEKHKNLVNKFLKIKPIGFCPPEFAWSPSLSTTLKNFQYQWSIIPQHLIDFSKILNEVAILKPKRKKYSAEIGAKILERSWVQKILHLPIIGYLFYKELGNTDHSPFYILGTNSEIIGIPNNRSWTGFINMALKNVALQSESKLKKYLTNQAQSGKGFFIPYLGDIENIEYGGNSPIVISIKDLERFLNIFEHSGFKIETPQEYLAGLKIEKKIYIKSGTGEPTGTFDMWTKDPDNFILEKMCEEIRIGLKDVKDHKRRLKIEKFLMLAENADGRAWNPLPERRLACFRAAEKALNLLK